MLKLNKHYSKLTLNVIKKGLGTICFCYYGIKTIFSINNILNPLYLVTENKIYFEKVGCLLNFLFLWKDSKKYIK